MSNTGKGKSKMTYSSCYELIDELENPELSKYSFTGGLIIFDGVCNLCNGGMQFIDKWDEKECLQMGWAQDTNIIDGILSHYHISKESVMNSFAFIEKESSKDKKLEISKKIDKKSDDNFQVNIFRGSTAWCHIAKYFTFPLNLLYYLIYVPEFIREFCYSVIGSNRYKWFGKSDACQRPRKSLLRRIVHPVNVAASKSSNNSSDSSGVCG